MKDLDAKIDLAVCGSWGAPSGSSSETKRKLAAIGWLHIAGQQQPVRLQREELVCGGITCAARVKIKENVHYLTHYKSTI